MVFLSVPLSQLAKSTVKNHTIVSRMRKKGSGGQRVFGASFRCGARLHRRAILHGETRADRFERFARQARFRKRLHERSVFVGLVVASARFRKPKAS